MSYDFPNSSGGLCGGVEARPRVAMTASDGEAYRRRFDERLVAPGCDVITTG